DVFAQRTVPTWYGGQCALTGVNYDTATHIIDEQSVKVMDKSQEIWGIISYYWPLGDIADFRVTGDELRNILPLGPDAHRLWDRNRLGLRPIPHPTNPETTLYLQVIWFDKYYNDNGWSESACSSKGSGIHDKRRPKQDAAGDVKHGDIYELKTSDPTNHPLPSTNLLQCRLAVQKLLAGAQAAGALREIFGGDPPGSCEGPVHVRDPGYMPRDWDIMLQEALDLGILNQSSESRWRQCIL
ncbi:hypothetical protein QBC39DRAFT_245934, partial [Podospora conica]